MITQHTNTAGIIWKIVTRPTKDEIVTLMKDMNIPDEYFEELETPTPKPICMDLSGTTYAVFHIPLHKKNDKVPLHYVEEEIDVLIRDKTIVTICYDDINTFNIDPEYAINNNNKLSKPIDLWWHILTHIYKDKHKDVDGLVVQVKELREKVFTDKEHIETISDIHRAYLAMDFPLEAHDDIIESILSAHGHNPKTASRVVLQLQGELHRMIQKLDKLGAYIHELRDTQSTLISARQNSLIQTFTILTFVFLPINFLAALFGMNVTAMPIVGHPLGFWILLGSFMGLSGILLIFFKIRRWL